ncbi:MAG TPA: SRPBCC domain-containing protein [Candidatus Dormibacteraeota bacterium]
MIPSAVEKEILIEAPIDVVWQLVTEPNHIRQWFADAAEIELRVGGRGALMFNGHDSYQLQVEALQPPRRFAFRWVRRPGLVLREDSSLLVEFLLEPENGSTRLRVVESGFNAIDWSDEETAKYAEDHAKGWQLCLGRLRDLARTKPAARE